MDAVTRGYPCPVCGFGLWFEPWREGSPADEICPCCGIQFGYDDAAGGRVEAREGVYRRWREKWVRAGMPWRGAGEPAPTDWDPTAQLRRIEAGADD
jgi:hypothetical protein